MDGAAFKAWREARDLTQDQAAEAAGVSRITVARAERDARKDVPAKLAALAHDGEMVAPPVAPKAERKPKAPPKGDLPRYGRTAAECREIRLARHALANKGKRDDDPTAIPLSNIPLVRLRPDWADVGGRKVNAAIPRPIPHAPPPSWAGWRGVPSADGHVYDYETAARMRRLEPVAEDW